MRLTYALCDQCGTANPSGVVNVNSGLATDVSGADDGADCVTVAPVSMVPPCAQSCVPPGVLLAAVPTAPIATTAASPAMPDTILKRVLIFRVFEYTSDHPTRSGLTRPSLERRRSV